MITDEEMQKALETVKEYCENGCQKCNFCKFCIMNIGVGALPDTWEIKKDED